MSRHILNSVYHERPIQVVLGWDRPLRGFFCTVQWLDDESDGAGFLYANLDDESTVNGFADLPYFRAKLVDLGVEVPERMYQEVERDGRTNRGNKHVVYQSDGTFRVLHEESTP